jgi:transcriptional regulator with XRE-family HTH domain
MRSEIRRLREERGLSMSELVAKAGISRDTLIMLEEQEGRDRPTVETMQAVARALGVSVADLTRDATTR